MMGSGSFGVSEACTPTEPSAVAPDARVNLGEEGGQSEDDRKTPVSL
jgi:hypothetical protein